MSARWIRIVITAFLAIPFMASQALSERLSVNLTSHQIAITSNFTGAKITLFGAIQHSSAPGIGDTDDRAEDDVIVIVRGPTENVTVRRKERIAGIWVNRAAVTFNDVPGFYFVASTQKLEDIISPLTLAREEIGTDRIELNDYTVHSDDLSEEEIAEFQAAILRQRTRQHLFGESEGGVLLQDNTLFSMAVDIPANVPVGDYVAKVMLVRDGVVVGSKSLFPSVNKTGIERMLYRFAHGSPFLYGVCAVLMAIIAGWTASAIFRRA